MGVIAGVFVGVRCAGSAVEEGYSDRWGWRTSMDSAKWKVVDVPHNWDDYGGYRRLRHGNLHGVAWYQRELRMGVVEPGKRYFLF
ncbi:hypothetical protein ACQ86N_33465 [Puia sp. P3]|uniref:hypothetical protein n=1 Tax=Puia sp. P3 TaxID=3423952 RepID=UPI003D6791BA